MQFCVDDIAFSDTGIFVFHRQEGTSVRAAKNVDNKLANDRKWDRGPITSAVVSPSLVRFYFV